MLLLFSRTLSVMFLRFVYVVFVVLSTLCVGKSASLIIVVQNPNPRSTVKINISIYPKNISLNVDGEGASGAASAGPRPRLPGQEGL